MTVREWLIENSFRNGRVEIVRNSERVYFGNANELSDSLLDTDADIIYFKSDRVICDIS